MSRLLFTSSGHGITEADVEVALRPMFAPGKILVTGGARGGDQIAERLWQQWGGQVDSHPVSAQAWQRSRSAGYARNAQMVAEVKISRGECLAVIARCTRPDCHRAHGTHGTVHCAGLAEAAGLPVTRIKAGLQPESGTGVQQPERPAHAAPAATGGSSLYCPPGAELPDGICPGCRTLALAGGRTACQACGAMTAMAVTPQQAAAYPGLAHGSPGHMCVLPGAVPAQREAEAGP